MNYSAIKMYDVANGPGVRMSLFVSGCPHHCKNCFNQETWDYKNGNKFTITECWDMINTLKEKKNIYKGVTILGGEPLCPDNLTNVYFFIRRLRIEIPEINIWVYTGYTLEELYETVYSEKTKQMGEFAREDFCNLLQLIDVLVDGRFIEEEKDLSIKFRGSRNQRIIDMKKTIQEKNIICIPDDKI